MVGPDWVVDRFPTRRSALLLARVALSRSGRMGRDDLAETLWPDDFIDSTRLRLRQELNRLREALGPAAEILSSDRSWVSIDFEKATVDVREFARLVANPDTVSKGIELYSGPVLPGSEEDWAVAERLEWQSKFLTVLIDRSQLLMEGGHAQEALSLALRAVRSDPTHEVARMAAMRAFAAIGDVGGAMRLYQDFERALQREFGVKPSAAISELASELRDSSQTATTPKPAEAREETLSVAPLPVYLDQRVGREKEVEMLVAWFTGTSPIRLATITGPGGVGKTRLATEAAKEVVAKSGTQVVFVGLADLEPGKKINAKLLDAFGLYGASESREPIPGLGNRPCLIVLDNAEHVLDDARVVTKEILLSHPRVQIITTSRQKLGIGGEQELPLAPLEPPGVLEGAEGLGDSPAAKLFMLRAQAVKPGYAVPEGQGEALAMLLERLDGLPLAIELAAARVGFLTPSQMLGEIDDRFTFLVTRRSDVSARQSSLRATIDWSFMGLDHESKATMGQLAIFRGGWSMELAKEALDAHDAVETIARLAERSLIHQEESAATPRFGMLETIRDYVIGSTDAEDLHRFRHRHAAVIARHQIMASRKLYGPEQHRWYEAIRTELDNSHVAIEWSADHDGKIAAMLGTALWRYWCARGLPGEGAYYLDRILSFPDQPKTPHWAETYLGRGKIATIQGDDETASEWYAKGLESYVDEDYAWGRSWARFLLACSKFEEGRIQKAAEFAEQSFDGANVLTIHFIKFILGKSLSRLGEVERGIAIAEDGFAAIIADEEQMSIGWAYASLAEVYKEADQVDAAFALISEGLVRLRAESIRDYILEATVRLARLELRRGKLDRVQELIAESRPLAQELGHSKSEMWISAMAGSLAAASGDLMDAIAGYESSLRKSRPRGGAMVPMEVARMLASDLLAFDKVEQSRLILAAEAGLRESLDYRMSILEAADLEAILSKLDNVVEPLPTRSTSDLVAVALREIAKVRVD